jgi:hypothetical protein
MAMMIHHARTPATPPSQVAGFSLPARLDAIVLACLEKEPEKRPSSALDLWQQLGDVPLETPWIAERAESWWREHLPSLAGPPHRGDSTSDLTLRSID